MRAQIWRINPQLLQATSNANTANNNNNNSQQPMIEFVANLSRHTSNVNVVRWHPRGGLLATAGDDGTVLIWKCTATNNGANGGEKKVAFGQDPAEADAELETWTAVSALMCVHILV